MQYQSISMQNRYFTYFSDFSHIGVDFRILICEFAYAWRPCYVEDPPLASSFESVKWIFTVFASCLAS